jgi:DNA-directed RNA polymerase subunit L
VKGLELEVKEAKKDHLEFIIKGERHTLPNLLKTRLLKEADVKFVAYSLKHPLDKDARFILKTEKQEAKKVLLDACKEIVTELEDFEKKVSKAMK